MNVSTIGTAASVVANPLFRTVPDSTDQPTDASAPANGPSRFASAIENAFASIGISLDGSAATSTTTAGSTASGTSGSTSAASAASTTADRSTDAVGAFLQSLFAALHAQSSGGTTASSSDDGSAASGAASDTSASAHAVGRGHHRHGGKLEADLNSLIESLGSTSTDATTDSASTTGTSSVAALDPTLAALEQNFDALAAQNGGTTSGGADTLTAFLKSLAANLHGAPATGNVVTTAA